MRRLCNTPGCAGAVTYRGYCAAHAADKERGTRRKGRAIYATKRWRILRRRVLFEQPLCPCGEIATEVDHIVAIAVGGAPYERANCQGLCAACHGRKTKVEQTSGVGWPD